MKHTTSAEGRTCWELADLFKNEAPPGWFPRAVAFEREMGIVRAAGARWDVSFSIASRGSREHEVEIVVMFHPTSKHHFLGLSARRRLQLFEFLEVIERKMRRLSFGGTFRVDDHDGSWTGYFNKYVKGMVTVRRELASLTSLRFEMDV